MEVGTGDHTINYHFIHIKFKLKKFSSSFSSHAILIRFGKFGWSLGVVI